MCGAATGAIDKVGHTGALAVVVIFLLF